MSCILMLLRTAVNPCPGNNVLWRSPATVGYFYPRHTSSFSAHSNKIPTVSPYFRGQAFQLCHFRYRVTSTSTINPRWRPPNWNVHILRRYGWCKIYILNTQWATLSNHDRDVRILEFSPYHYDDVTIAQEIITEHNNQILHDDLFFIWLDGLLKM